MSEEDNRKAALAVLNFKRERLELKVGKIQILIDNHTATPLSRGRVTSEIEYLKGYEEKLSELEEQILEKAKGFVEVAANEAALENASDKLKETQGKAQQLLLSLQSTIVTTKKVKLKDLEQPRFSGELRDWQSFKNAFKASVIDHTEDGDVRRLQYLQAAMKGGKAEHLISFYEINGENYAKAMDQLEERFEHERRAVDSHLSRFFSLPSLVEENGNKLQSMVDITTEVLNSLESLVGEDVVKRWDILVVHVLTQKLDGKTRREWDVSRPDKKVQTLKTFLSFVQQKASALDCSPCKQSSQSSHNSSSSSSFIRGNFKNSNGKPTSNVATTQKDSKTCEFCEQKDHPNYLCPTFKSLQVSERKKLVREKALCFNCINAPFKGHKCERKPCRTCKENIHYLIHTHESPSVNSTLVNTDSNQESSSSSHLSQSQPGSNVMLLTTMVEIRDSSGVPHQIRALLDSGSQVNFLSERAVQLLQLLRRKSSIPISGISGAACGPTRGLTTATIGSIVNKMWKTSLDCYILPRVTSDQPQRVHSNQKWKHLSNIPLADPNYYRPGPIDLLIGAAAFGDLIRPGKLSGPVGTPTALETELGWAILGTSDFNPENIITSHHAELDFDLTRFWSQEEISDHQISTPEEKACEDHFVSTHSRDETGRYIVQLPFKRDSKPLGDSRHQALVRLYQIERRLTRHPEYRVQYLEAMDKLVEMGHMELVPAEDLKKPNEEIFYLPHHFVTKESSTSTKLRIVLDGSAKSTSGISLNEKLMVGPTIQPELISTLMRFRTHQFALCADIRQMYHQVRVHPIHTDYLRILWRNSPNEPVLTYRLLKVLFGISSAPFLAIRSLQQLAVDEGSSFPLACQAILNDMYVDDLLSGAPDIVTALQLQRELLQLTEKGSFELTKWTSNSPRLLEAIPESMRETQLPMEIESTTTIKTLGIHWNPLTDEFCFKVCPPEEVQPTKRGILSYISKLYDPMGWVQPIITKGKILMKKLWEVLVNGKKLGWDDPIPDEIQQLWTSYIIELPETESIRIPRWIFQKKSTQFELHGFSDASENAYGAAVYLRTKVKGSYSTHLITSKSKVAPVERKTIPRLELMGALLLAKLMRVVNAAMKLQIQTQYYWTDSSVVLHWISGPSSKRKIFVANRVSKIHELSSFEEWNHVKGEENPSDCVSRGIFPAELTHHPLWWQGPPWLKFPIPPRGKLPVMDEDVDLEEKKPKISSFTSSPNDLSLLYNATDWMELLTTTAKSNDQPNSITNSITPTDIHKAELQWIKAVQSEVFSEDLKRLANGLQVKQTSRLKSLNPMIDSNGVLIVGGRLEFADIPQQQKHPIILPSFHHLTNLIIKDRHLNELHAGAQQLIASLASQYWILQVKKTIKGVIRKCQICVRLQAKNSTQLMGQLPSSRVNITRAFHSTGVDYAGPFEIKKIGVRGTRSTQSPTYKGYVAVFICMATKAIHLELASQLDTPAFIAAFRRFVSRRGKPVEMFSDNGKNFEGADNELKRLITSVQHNNNISSSLLRDGIKWNFNPPHAPHMGGLWEAAVKGFKHHFKRVVGLQILTFEEFTTTLTQIEAVLNSRPLVPISSNPEDFTILTPGHFLTGGPLTELPDPDLTHLSMNRLSRWQLVQRIQQDFRSRWVNEYLQKLQQRTKWRIPMKNVRVGDAAILMEENVPALKWPTCRITEVHPGSDGLVRSVSVQLENGTRYQRPIVKLVLLPSDDKDSMNFE